MENKNIETKHNLITKISDEELITKAVIDHVYAYIWNQMVTSASYFACAEYIECVEKIHSLGIREDYFYPEIFKYTCLGDKEVVEVIMKKVIEKFPEGIIKSWSIHEIITNTIHFVVNTYAIKIKYDVDKIIKMEF